MGASKRLCELYIQSLSRQKGIKTHFITTRFGNVLGSNGSVIPLFKKQISTGGPVTVTDKRVYRYFMTIPEACQLVMEAGFMGAGGEIYLFDMGKPVRIYDLAEKMISLSGYVPHEEIKIVEIGLRPGEKLFEELLVDQEESFHTTHKKIMIARIRPYPYQKTLKMIDELLSSLTELTDLELVTKMKMIVPEFLSNNSKYEALDIKPEDQKAV
jgi:FlaA1/EpsC-like NDP-sugar epimerase